MSILRDRLSKYISTYLNTRIVFALDVVLSVVASVVVALCSFLFEEVKMDHHMLLLVWATGSLAFSFLSILAFRSYRIIIRHASMRDISRYVLASTLKVVLLGILTAVLLKGSALAIVTMCISDFALTTFLVVGVRMLMLAVYEVYKNRLRDGQKYPRILIYGTSDKSVAIVTRLKFSKHYTIVGFLERGRSSVHRTMEDLPVYYFSENRGLDGLVSNLSIYGILFAREEDAKKEKDGLVSYASANGVKVLMAPPIDEVNAEQFSSRYLREVNIEDLLGRDEIEISMSEIIENFRDKVVMVTGAAGSIGSELVFQLAGFGVSKIILFDNAETPMHNLRLQLEEKFPSLDFVPVIGDVRQEPRVDYAFRTWRPQIVFHAAAYKHVPLMEENPCEAVLVNVAGSRNVADKCIQYGVEKMIMISTDKAVNPTNIMGCTKRLAEIYVQSLGLAVASGEIKGRTCFVTTRFGNVLGSNGSVIPRFREQIAKGGPVTVTHPEITRFFMTIPEACRLVMEAATISSGNQICVFDMGEPVKIDTLARRMIELSGLVPDVDVKIEYTGLRPGEKLYEEVLATVENTAPTSHDRIRVACVRKYPYEDARKAVDELEHLSRIVDIPEMVKLMKIIVPEFISRNSRFEIYDAPQV